LAFLPPVSFNMTLRIANDAQADRKATVFWARKQAEKPVRELRSVPTIGSEPSSSTQLRDLRVLKNPASQ
jgi:hypothetical protein